MTAKSVINQFRDMNNEKQKMAMLALEAGDRLDRFEKIAAKNGHDDIVEVIKKYK